MSHSLISFFSKDTFVILFSLKALAKIQTLLVFCLGFVRRQKTNVLKCAAVFFSHETQFTYITQYLPF